MPNLIALKNNPIEKAHAHLTEIVGKALDENPLINKIVIIANYIFRIAMMATFMAALPFSTLPSFLIGLGINVFYNITIERFCQYRFAILSCVGAETYKWSKPAYLALLKGAAFTSLSAFGKAFIAATPFSICAAIIVASVNQNVNKSYALTHPGQGNEKTHLKHLVDQSKKSCCKSS